MNFVDPSIALGLLLLGIAIGAFLSREYYRCNLQAILDEEIEKRCRCDGNRSDPVSRRSTQLIERFAVRLQGGRSPQQAN